MEHQYFVVRGQGILWGWGTNREAALCDAERCYALCFDDDEPTLAERLEQSQGYNVGEGWAIMPATEKAYNEIVNMGSNIYVDADSGVIMLDCEGA